MHALQALGHEVVPFEFLTHTVRRGRIRRAIEGRLAWGPTIMAFNRALAAAVTPRVGVWGNWAREVKRSPDLRPLWRAPGVWGVDYAKAMGCASIGLSLLSRLAPDRHTTRTFEIPACGTFLLAERTEEHQELFEEGREAEFFGDLDELQDKIRYYLAHPDERKRIAAAGRERCLRGGYSYHDRMRGLLQKVADLRPVGGPP